MNPKSPISHDITIGACLLAGGGLLYERYLTQMGKSLCHTSACEIVAKYVRFGEPALLAVGAANFLLLAGLIFFAWRYQQKSFAATLPLLALIGSAAFDGALLGFQFVTLRQHCQLCITVAIALCLIAALYSISLKRWSIIASCLVVWGAGFMASAILIMPDTTEAKSGMVFYERNAAQEFSAPPVATLIFSVNCPHCKEVLAALAQKNPKHISWRFAVIDDSLASINRLGYFYANASSTANPFQLLLDSKGQDTTVLDKKVSAKFPDLTRQARLFLANNKINSVPVLVFQENKAKTIILTGSTEIEAFVKALSLPPSPPALP